MRSIVGVVIRPSGTEPKLKVYISVIAEDRNRAKEIESEIMTEVKRRLNVIIGAGSVVIRNIPDNCIAVDVPCKVIGCFENYKKDLRIDKVSALSS